jgi:hypothetical protein
MGSEEGDSIALRKIINLLHKRKFFVGVWINRQRGEFILTPLRGLLDDVVISFPTTYVVG